MIDVQDVKTWLGAVRLRDAAAYVVEVCRGVIGMIGRSFRVLVKSTAVWGAVLLLFVGGFWVGYLKGVAGKRALRSQVVTLQHDAAAQSARIEALQGGNQAAIADIRKLKGEKEALTAEIARLAHRPAANSEAPAAPARRRAIIVRSPAAAAREAPDLSWRPF